MNIHEKTIWLIGASSGIGESLAEALADTNARIYISARNHEKLMHLHSLYPDRLVPLPMDVTDDWSVNAAMQKIEQRNEAIDQVIVNAGTCEYIDSYEIDVDTVRRVMETNFFGALNVANHSLRLLRKCKKNGGEPQLVFVSSSVTYQALPRAGAYGASKSALRYFAECLRIDLQKEGIDVRVVSPGFVETPLTDKNDFPMPFKVSSDEAAIAIIDGLKKRSFDIAFPKPFIASLKAIAALPNLLKFRLLAKASRHDADKVDLDGVHHGDSSTTEQNFQTNKLKDMTEDQREKGVVNG